MSNLLEKEERISFYKQISRNKRSSIFLIFIIAIFLVVIIYFIGLISGLDIFLVSIFAIIISMAYIIISYSFSKKIVLWSVGAIKADETKYREYHNLVEGLCLAAGIPKPELYVMKSPQINAFATGRNPKDAAICVTTGALEKLNKRELEGVLAHEISHILNYDVRFMTLVAVLVGLISILADTLLRSIFYSSSSQRDRGDGKGGILIVVAIALAVLSPILVSLVQLAISRRREFMADASAVKIVRSPTGLISALEKIKANEQMRVPKAVAPLFFAKPSKIEELFSTHPPIEKRIEILKKM